MAIGRYALTLRCIYVFTTLHMLSVIILNEQQRPRRNHCRHFFFLPIVVISTVQDDWNYTAFIIEAIVLIRYYTKIQCINLYTINVNGIDQRWKYIAQTCNPRAWEISVFFLVKERNLGISCVYEIAFSPPLFIFDRMMSLPKTERSKPLQPLCYQLYFCEAHIFRIVQSAGI